MSADPSGEKAQLPFSNPPPPYAPQTFPPTEQYQPLPPVGDPGAVPPQPTVVQQVIYIERKEKTDLQQWYEAIPVLPMRWAVLTGIINILIPGAGTMLAGALAKRYAQIPPNFTAEQILSINLICGVWQLLIFVIFFAIGWIIGIIWGVTIISISSKRYGKPQPEAPPGATIPPPGVTILPPGVTIPPPGVTIPPPQLHPYQH